MRSKMPLLHEPIRELCQQLRKRAALYHNRALTERKYTPPRQFRSPAKARHTPLWPVPSRPHWAGIPCYKGPRCITIASFCRRRHFEAI